MTDEHNDLDNCGVASSRASPELFDGQAGCFEERAGLPEDCCHDIAHAVLELGRAGPPDLIVEVGAGTGQVGALLAASARYAGFDLSAGMLGQFRRRLAQVTGNHVIVRADANRTWPLAAGSTRIVFSSRAMHLLDHEHVAREVFRIASHRGATLVLGRVERAADSTRTRMAREMNERLRSHGFQGRRGERQNRKLLDACCQRGAEPLVPVTVASWKVSTSPRQSLDSWRRLTGLGGIPVPGPTRDEILSELETWAEEAFGGIDRESESVETYVLRSFRLPAANL